HRNDKINTIGGEISPQGLSGERILLDRAGDQWLGAQFEESVRGLSQGFRCVRNPRKAVEPLLERKIVLLQHYDQPIEQLALSYKHARYLFLILGEELYCGGLRNTIP